MVPIWSVALLMACTGGIAISLGGYRGISPFGYLLAAILVGGGGLLLTKKWWSFYVALGAIALVLVSGVVGLAGHREHTLPLPPALNIGIAVYLGLRLFMVRSLLKRRKSRSSGSSSSSPSNEIPV